VEPKPLRSGELARLSGVSPDTLRHYERIGVLPRPDRSANGYRRYAPNALDRVRLVRRALVMGFTLDELRRILAARDRGSPPCGEVRRLAAEKLAGIETRLDELASLREELQETIRDWDARLEATAPGQPARLLESLTGRLRSSARRSHFQKPLRREMK
jgi:DNA-binding transcriptional MerR regulator